jgi:hypothetical protein
VVFIVNKVDILSSDEEVEEVTRFVANSATRLLGVDRTQVLAVSARAALTAKLAVGGGKMAGENMNSFHIFDLYVCPVVAFANALLPLLRLPLPFCLCLCPFVALNGIRCPGLG